MHLPRSSSVRCGDHEPAPHALILGGMARPMIPVQTAPDEFGIGNHIISGYIVLIDRDHDTDSPSIDTRYTLLVP